MFLGNTKCMTIIIIVIVAVAMVTATTCILDQIYHQSMPTQHENLIYQVASYLLSYSNIHETACDTFVTEIPVVIVNK